MTSTYGMAALIVKADRKPQVTEPRRDSPSIKGGLFERVRQSVEERFDAPEASAVASEEQDTENSGAEEPVTYPEVRENETAASADLLPEEAGAAVSIPVPYQLFGEAMLRSGEEAEATGDSAAVVGPVAGRNDAAPVRLPEAYPVRPEAYPVRPEDVETETDSVKPAPKPVTAAAAAGPFRAAEEAAATDIGSAAEARIKNPDASAAETAESPAGPAMKPGSLAEPAAGGDADPGDGRQAFGRGEKAPGEDASGLPIRPAHTAEAGRFAATTAAVSGTDVTLPADETAQGPLLVRQIVESVEYAPSSGKNGMVVRLRPDVFGELKIDFEMQDDRLTARIVTDSHPTRVLLQSHLDSLQDALADKGIPVREILVEYADTGTDTSGSPADDPRRHSAGRNRTHIPPGGRDRADAPPTDRIVRSARMVRTGGIDMMA
ncbi:MAG: flagellar hook-length control protein FliK [Clostridia bacterium]|nr:flagellar hook-length control protein FliK [Clostridia bacterium]